VSAHKVIDSTIVMS